MVGIATAKGTTVSGKHQRVSSESSGEARHHLKQRGSPGESIYENLELLAKSVNQNGREIRSLEYRRGIKDPNTTQLATWAHRPHSHVSKTIFKRLDSTLAKELERGSYRQSALIPTCDAPNSTVH